MDDKVELLRRVPLFGGMDDAALAEVAGIAEEIEAPAGTALTHEGRHEGYFFIVVAGSVKITRSGRAINLMGPGDFLGEVALLDGGPRTATAVAEVPSTLLRITNEDFFRLVDGSANVRAAVLAAAGSRLRALDGDAPI
jgi:CRP/FNR family transcriptional regulator, cyclic AMP receptor protein